MGNCLECCSCIPPIDQTCFCWLELRWGAIAAGVINLLAGLIIGIIFLLNYVPGDSHHGYETYGNDPNYQHSHNDTWTAMVAIAIIWGIGWLIEAILSCFLIYGGAKEEKKYVAPFAVWCWFQGIFALAFGIMCAIVHDIGYAVLGFIALIWHAYCFLVTYSYYKNG